MDSKSMQSGSTPEAPVSKITLKRKPQLYSLVSKMKLWPSQKGIVHGVKNLEIKGSFLRISTYCGVEILVKNSKRNRAARWLRNRWAESFCQVCNVPKWKIKRYGRNGSR